MKIHFEHGWGLDGSYWDTLKHYFPKNFPDHINIGIGHSLGLTKILLTHQQTPLKFNALIGLNSFVNFLGFNSDLRQKRQHELLSLQKQFTLSPTRTLARFYKNAGILFNSSLIPLPGNITSLNQDLNLLKESIILPNHIPVLILGSENDNIVPPELIHDNFSPHNNITLKFHHSGQHNLAQLHPEWVSHAIQEFTHGL